MRKIIRNITVCMILVMVCMFNNALPVFADESVESSKGDVITEEIEEGTYNADMPLDNDGLFENYIESRLMTVEEPEVAGRRGSKLEGANRAIYNKLKKEIELVADGTRTSTIFEVTIDELNLEKNEWNATDLGVTTIVEDGTITEEAQISLLNQLDIDLDAIVRALIADCPYELYWFDKVVGVSMSGLEVEASYYGEEWHLSLSSGITISFAVAQGYAAGNYQVDTSNAERVQHAVDKAAMIVENAKEKTDYDKLVYYRQTICALVTYDYVSVENSSTPYGDAWQVISVFDEDIETNVVCEGYSKAFQYLCDLTSFDGDISCITVTGKMTGGTGEGTHMWNIINMEDDKNYLVDVTNCDEGTIGADDQLFLAGQENGEVDTGYTYKCEGGTIVYTYDADTLKDYDTELIMSNQRYKEYGIEVTEDNLVYRITGNHATLIGHEGNPTSVVIPSTVRGVPVTSIGNNAFCRSETLTNVFIPATVETIEDGVSTSWIPDQKGAFLRCKNLENVQFEDSSKLNYLGECSFSYCSSLKNINLPDGVKIIGMDAFEMCRSLTELHLPQSLTQICQNGLSYTGIETLEFPATLTDYHYINFLPDLRSFTVEEGNPVYRASEGVLYGKMNYSITENGTTVNKTGWTLINYPLKKQESEYKVPDYAELILGDNMFSIAIMENEDGGQYLEEFRNEYLQTIDINNCLIEGVNLVVYDIVVGNDNPYYSVKDGVLYSKDLTEVVRIFDSLTGKVTIPDGVKSIWDGAGNYGNFTEIELPESLESIGNGAFLGSSIERVTVPNNVSIIGVQAFQECENLKDVNLSEQISVIKWNTFESCISLEEISLPEDLQEIEMQAFTHCSSLKKIKIPNSVTAIGRMAFGDCYELSEVILPDNFGDKILDSMFYRCLKLKEFVISSHIKEIEPCAFTEAGLTSIDIPDNVEVVGEMSFNSSSLRWVSIRNPKCELFDSENTFNESTVICGYPGSTAESYAKKYNRQFISLNDINPQKIYMIDKIEPTCSNEGMLSHYTDNINLYLDEEGCNIVSKDDLIIPKLDHDWSDWTVTKEATEDEEGLENRICSRDSSHTEERILPKLSHIHNLVKTDALEATCTRDGNIDYWTCNKCQKIYRDQNGDQEITEDETVIKAKGHSWDDTYTVDQAATTVADGFKSIHCHDCEATGEFMTIPRISQITLSESTFVYDGTKKIPIVTVVDTEGTELVENTDYCLSYADDCVNVGNYFVIVEFMGDYGGVERKVFEIEESEILLGDINADGKLNIRDVMKLKEYLADSETVTINTAAADLDENGKLNIRDVMKLKEMLANN